MADRPENRPEDVLEGVLLRVLFRSEDDAFTVASLRPARGAEVRVVGALGGLHEGEQVRLRGQWRHTERFGHQFQVHVGYPILPQDPEGIRRYLASGRVKGVGKGLAERLVAAFGHETLRVVAEEDFTHIIIDAVNEIPSLKWISPARPKTLENQLEFSACYWNSVLQLSYGPGRLDNASLFNGSWNFQVSRISLYTCCVCCCLSNSLSVFTLPILLITANYHMYRVARTVCIIDYLVDDKFATSAAQEIPQAG